MLDEERQLIEATYANGPRALFEAGYSVAAAMVFMDRADVRAEMQLHDSEFNNRETLLARLRFIAKKSLAKFAIPSAAILARALMGPTYRRNTDGSIAHGADGKPIIDALPPTDSQVNSARDILDRLGVSGDVKEVTAQTVNIVTMIGMKEDALKLPLEDDTSLATEEMRGLSRERVRNLIDELTPQVNAGYKRVTAALKYDKGTTSFVAKELRKADKRKAKRRAAKAAGVKKQHE